ncbi:MAG: ABC transporter substrate-binding protein [Candidatus Thorarchaeota archaeon]
MGSKSAIRVVMVCFFVIILFSSTITINAVFEDSENPCSGSYMDKVVYTVDTNEASRILALQAGTFDALLDPIDPTHLSVLEADPDIGIYSIPENGYGRLAINCRKYPLNISAFRRAIAYAIDKTRIVSEARNNHAIGHDSVFPLRSNWCIEDDLPYDYYANQSDFGNQILDNLGFVVDPGTNMRQMPNGTFFSLTILSWDHPATMIVADALASLHIPTLTEMGTMWIHSFYPKDYDPNYDLAIHDWSFFEDDPDSILSDYLSQFADVSYINQYGYENDSFDTLFDQFHSATTYEQVFETTSAMQKHLQENVPSIILYEDIDYQAYRISELTGHVEDEFWGILGPWTNLKVHTRSGSPFGGIYNIATGLEPSTYNFLSSNNYVSKAVSENLQSSLFKMGPDNVAYPDLVKEILIENHASNPSVPEGQTWITVDIKDNAVWSDGELLTAEDIAFTFMYINETRAYGNSHSYYGWPNDYMSSQVLSSYKARMVLSTESFYNIQQLLHEKIIPEHIYNEETGLGYAEWSYSAAVPTCGPFSVSDFDNPEILTELSRAMDYHWASGLAPRILSVNDVTYIQGTTGNQIVWEVTDEDGDHSNYTIIYDGFIGTTEDWNGSNIVHNVDGLNVGSYNFTMILRDIAGHAVTSTVWVTVTSGLPDILFIGTIVGSAAVIVGAIVLILKKKR